MTDFSTAGPGDDTDAVFVTRFPLATVRPGFGPRAVFLSKEGNAGFDTSVFEDGDVFRYASQGGARGLRSEAQLLEAVGQSSSSELDLDAICQSETGDLFVSVRRRRVAPGGTADDGWIVRIPASAITYDATSTLSRSRSARRRSSRSRRT